jgi:hypothetical protein
MPETAAAFIPAVNTGHLYASSHGGETRVVQAAVLSLVFASNVNGGARSSDSDALR